MNQKSTDEGANKGQHSFTKVPSVNLPKGGGAIRGIGEKFTADPVTGTGSISVPIATSPGRSGFSPQLSLTYNSGAGNGPFGVGWHLALPSITRKTDKGIPKYLDAEESDVFILSGVEDLVPVLVRNSSGEWVSEEVLERTVNAKIYRIRRYRPRIEGSFARIERWSNSTDAGEVFWRSISKDNVTTWYGRSPNSRIADPKDPTRIFSWLICESHDDKGNVIVYGYQAEDSARIFEDATGIPLTKAHERNRSPKTRSAQRYLKYIRYGNHVPYFPALKANAPWPEPAGTTDQDGSKSWYFEAIIDYGEHDADMPTPNTAQTWPARTDAFSTYRAGFEVRSYRICRRVLMFHHFPGAADVGSGCLVRSTDFGYSDDINPGDTRNPIYTFLHSVTQTSYRRNNVRGYDRRSLPPVEFVYTEPLVQDQVEEVDAASLENLPIGLDESRYRWIDLHGEGIPGILSEHVGAWFFKRNLSPIPEQRPDGSRKVKAQFAPVETVAQKPNVTLRDSAWIQDLAGDGLPDVVTLEDPAPGLYEHDEAEGWQPFRPFMARLNRMPSDPNLKFIDLDGDGRADVLITEDNTFVWHSSLAEAGFGPAQRVAKALDEEKGPRVIFADVSQAIYLADLSGDGLTDIARIRNGEVCYWPNLGYGHFGAKVTMDNTPWFDHTDRFDQRRIRLADIDGSGSTDIIYLHPDGVQLYFNQSGNGWSSPQILKAFPRVDDPLAIMPLDLLGNGTACLVWSSPLPRDAGRPMTYVNLMGNRKPHLLIRSYNNLGAETRIDYAPSTRFYLEDRRDDKPWITRLPFPVHLVERVETLDHISRNRFVTRYAYHHGYFDGAEREFRGFGMVEQWDTEELAVLNGGKIPDANIATVSNLPPVRTKTWFHTGVHLGRQRVSRQFEDEYYREPGLDADAARLLLLDDTALPTGLTHEEEREACRALKGSMLRQEVYADDAGPDATAEQIQCAHTPYSVTEQNYAVRILQPQGKNRHAVFFTHGCEALSYHYERNPADPRIQHALTLEVDSYGNVLKEAAIGYGRRSHILRIDDQKRVQRVPNPGLADLSAIDRAKQTTALLTYTENRITRDHDTGETAIDRDDTYRTPLPCETITFELTGYPATGPADRYQATDLIEPDPVAVGRLRHRFNTPEVPYEATAQGARRRRPIEQIRTLYRRDDLDGLLPLGELQPLALPGESYRLAFTPGLIGQVFERPREGQQPEPLLPLPSGVLGDRGGYLQSQPLKADGRFPANDPDDHWWIPSGQSYYSVDPTDNAATEFREARRHFFLPRRYRDPFGQHTFIDFDARDLLMSETRDALGNRVTVEANDYRVLQPRLISDPNRNRTEVAFDTLGLVVGTAVMGKPQPAPVEGDSLVGFKADLTEAERDGFFNAADPHAVTADLLKDATTRIIYDLDRFRRTRLANPDAPERWQPPCSATLARETHVTAALPPQGLKIQLAFSYSDGLGREIQQKIQAEPGPLDPNNPAAPHIDPRWVGSGWTLFNNKGRPVRQYEPFFSVTHDFEFGITAGVSPVLFYDPVGRVIATLHPNHTYEKAVFDPWGQTAYDVNDTCAARNAETGDPRSDPDIGGYVRDYFQALQAGLTHPWRTWHALRINGDLGPDEQNAAQRAEAHADTPASTHFDVLGRPYLTIARNRVACPNHPLDGREESVATRIDLDIEGNQIAVRDERQLPVNHRPTGTTEQRIVMRYAYDMLGNRIRQDSMEAGARWMLDDAAGETIRAWDSRGHNFTTVYDALHRPVEQYVRGSFSDPDPLKPNSDPATLNSDVLVERVEYGEGVANAEALNLRTRVYRHFDAAGSATNARLGANGDPVEAYDFKGNLLCSTRRFVRNYKNITNWRNNPTLEDESFESSTRYDALNRAIQSIAPHSSLERGGFNVIQPVFNAANLLEQVDVWLERTTEPAALLDPDNEAPSPVGVAGIDYDAKGQRRLIDYKTNSQSIIRTRYDYDPETLRLTRLNTRRGVNPRTTLGVGFAGDCENKMPSPSTTAAPDRPPEADPCGLQNLSYTYDPAGNITHIRDAAQQAIYFDNRRVDPNNDYHYDAWYRLIQATGREHLGQNGQPLPHSHDDAARIHQPHPNNGNQMARYCENYVYDAVGNFLSMSHHRQCRDAAGWTRNYDYLEPSLTEQGDPAVPPKVSNRLTRTLLSPAGNAPQPEAYLHDAHGNMLRMPHLGGGQAGPNLHWNYKDELRQTDLGGGGKAFYVYDASGERVRKVWEKAPGLIEERIYLGGFEIFRRYGAAVDPNTAVLERETLHLMDDEQRIALVETCTLDRVGTDRAPRQLIRYQFGNHLGSASLELDEQAQIISYEEYAPYGSTTYHAVHDLTETAKRYRYTGKERDEETGLYYHGARYYAAWLGRWTASDPTDIVDGLNLFQYTLSNPINHSDPSGTNAIPKPGPLEFELLKWESSGGGIGIREKWNFEKRRQAFASWYKNRYGKPADPKKLCRLYASPNPKLMRHPEIGPPDGRLKIPFKVVEAERAAGLVALNTIRQGGPIAGGLWLNAKMRGYSNVMALAAARMGSALEGQFLSLGSIAGRKLQNESIGRSSAPDFRQKQWGVPTEASTARPSRSAGADALMKNNPIPIRNGEDPMRGGIGFRGRIQLNSDTNVEYELLSINAGSTGAGAARSSAFRKAISAIQQAAEIALELSKPFDIKTSQVNPNSMRMLLGWYRRFGIQGTWEASSPDSRGIVANVSFKADPKMASDFSGRMMRISGQY